MGPERQEEESASEKAQDEENSRTSELRAAADREAQTLQEGPGISLFGAEIPYRVLIAIAVFVVVFVAVWAAVWALLGGIGLALGWIFAAVVGALAVRLVGRA
jgi:hypothetical protein